MFKYVINKLSYILFYGGVVIIFSINLVLGFDLSEEVSSSFKKSYDRGFSNSYISNIYSSDFSKDPFGDAILNIEDVSIQPKIAGAEYIKNLLATDGCSLSQKKIRGILYYYVPEFRAEVAKTLKQDIGDYDSKKYVFDKDVIMDYCREFYFCEKGVGENLGGISANTPQNIETNCKEFFEKKYMEGKDGNQVIQNVKSSNLGVDKYWNQTVDDSPYDIMSDLGVLSKLLYQEAQDPITPVLYNIPLFSNSKNKLSDTKNSDGNNNGNNTEKSVVNEKVSDSYEKMGSEQVGISGKIPSKKDGSYSDIGGKDGENLPKSPNTQDFDDESEYDKLVEGLNGYSVVDDGTSFYNNLCKKEEKTEPEPNVSSDNDNGEIDSRSFSELSNQEYQELIDYMLEAVDEYSSLPSNVEDSLEDNVGDSIIPGSTDQLDEVADEIKKCWSSCDGLRIDQKASCMLKCACGEIKSPIFDPKETPGLGPIYMIRFCAVPGMDTRFSVGGKRIHSIEEGVKEIYGVVDKLSREGRLGKWTQQNQFLDSSTKQMKLFDSVAFTIDVELVDIVNNMPIRSEQYKKRKLKSDNEKGQLDYSISAPLDDSSLKNTYRIVGNQGDISDFKGSNNADRVRDSLLELNYPSRSVVDLISNSDASRYSKFSESLGRWMDQQGALWILVSRDISDLDLYSKALYQKKCE